LQAGMLLVSIFFFMIPAICFSGGTGDVNIDVDYLQSYG
jgi:hypothetical protein